MSSIKGQIETETIALLNAGSFSQSFTAERGPIAEEKIEQITSLIVLVTARLEKRSRKTRGANEWNFTLSVGIGKKVGFTNGLLDPDGLEAMQLLIEELAAAMDGLTFTEFKISTPVVPEIDYVADGGAMWDKGIVLMQVDVPLILWTDRPS